MGLINASDLHYDYSNTTTKGDDPSLINSPDNCLLNRGEKYEVLHFINKIARDRGWSTKDKAFALEVLIRKYLPSNFRSHAHIKTWLENNFTTLTKYIY